MRRVVVWLAVVRLKVGRYRVFGEYEPDWGSFGDGVDDEVSVVKGKSAWRCWALVLGEGSAEYRCNRAPIGMSWGVCYVPEGEADWTLTVVPEDVTDVAVVSGRRYVFRAGRLEQEVEGFSEWKE